MGKHELKILPTFFYQQAKGLKNWELRKNDRDFKVGDELILKEYDGESFTGCYIRVAVLAVFKGGRFGLHKDYCILSTKRIN